MLGVVSAGTLSGCTTTPATAVKPVEVVCPPRVQDLANALARYRARRGVWPPALRDLVFADLLEGVMPRELDRYGYAGGPLGVLPDGRRVMLVDDVRQADDTLWCVVESKRTGGMPTIEVVAVPLDTLAAVAR